MLLRVALALTFSIAALRYAKRRRRYGLPCLQTGRRNRVKTTRSFFDLDESAQKIQEEEENASKSHNAVVILDLEGVAEGQVVLPIDSESFGNEDGAAFELKYPRDAVMDTQGHEINHLKTVASAIREKEMRIRAQLIDSGSLMERLKGRELLEDQLTKQDSKIKAILSQIACLEDSTSKAFQELAGKEASERELKLAKTKIRELHKERKNDADHRQTHLQILKEQLTKLQEVQEQNSRKESAHQKNLMALKNLRAEIQELKDGIKKLSEAKQKLTAEVAAAEKRITEVSAAIKNKPEYDSANEATNLWNENINLKKLVEEEQASRFREVEEVVYLRWVNACLQYELDMHRASYETPTASDIDEADSPASLQKRKQGMLHSPRPVLMPLNVKEEGSNIIDNASMLPFPSESPAVNISPRKRHPLKLFVRSSSSLSTDSEASITSPKTARRSSLETQEVGSFVRSPSSLSTDSENSIASPKPRRHSSPVLEAYLQRDAGEVRTRDFNRASSRFSSSASFGSRSNSGISSPGSVRKGILRHLSASTAESYTDRPDAAGSVASSFEILSAVNCASAKHLAFKDLRRLTSVTEEARVGKPAETLSKDPVQDNQSAMKNRETAVEKFSREDIENDPVGHPSPTKSPEIRRFKHHENSKTPGRDGMASPKSSPRVYVVIGQQSERTHGSPPASPCIPSSPAYEARARADPRQSCNSSTSHIVDNCHLQKSPQEVGVQMFPTPQHAASAHRNAIKEIEDGSTFFLAVKADVYTKGDFVQYLASKIRDAAYTEIEDVVAFVKWVDNELLLLVDERAVVKHFDWPENILDALREAAFHYQDMKNLEVEINSFQTGSNTPGHVALNSMLALQEKTEKYINMFLGSRDLALVRYKTFNIPTDWMLDSGLLGEIKLASVQLAQKYMKRVLLELEQFRDIPAEKRSRDILLVQAARFAFKAHQIAGGFDLETLSTFKDLRKRSYLNDLKEQPTPLEGCP